MTFQELLEQYPDWDKVNTLVQDYSALDLIETSKFAIADRAFMHKDFNNYFIQDVQNAIFTKLEHKGQTVLRLFCINYLHYCKEMLDEKV